MLREQFYSVSVVSFFPRKQPVLAQFGKNKKISEKKRSISNWIVLNSSYFITNHSIAASKGVVVVVDVSLNSKQSHKKEKVLDCVSMHYYWNEKNG